MPKTAKILFVTMLATLVAGFVFPPLIIVSLICSIALFAYLIARRLTMSEEDLEKNRKEVEASVAKWNAKAEEAKRKQERSMAELDRMVSEEKKRKEDDRRAVSAVLITTNSKKSGVGRAVVGGALFGPVGAIAGAATGSSKATRATFSVKYASGKTGTETVTIGGRRFNELSELLHNEK